MARNVKALSVDKKKTGRLTGVVLWLGRRELSSATFFFEARASE
jgi:hypothetical protein